MCSRPSPRQGERRASCPCPDVLEVKVEKIVSFDHVRIELDDLLPETYKHVRLPHVASEENLRVAAVVHEGDGRILSSSLSALENSNPGAQAVSMSRARR